MGSSPLSRGILGIDGESPEVRGIIPALAGNTCRCPPRRRGSTDHPRSRGEYEVMSIWAVNWAGSSPLSRGIRSRSPAVHPGRGIIPALAGNTEASMASHNHEGDHPRSRGEYATAAPRLLHVRGSSPLSRGILIPISGLGKQHRIIPALAGNTAPDSASQKNETDHPRSRGEYSTVPIALMARAGSSPLSRGIRRFALRGPARSGIIPALAGNTLSNSPFTLVSLGSSPLSRGIRVQAVKKRIRIGIIPALAGNTSSTVASSV